MAFIFLLCALEGSNKTILPNTQKAQNTFNYLFTIYIVYVSLCFSMCCCYICLHHTYTMITPKLILYTHKTYKDGTHPVIVQIVINSKPYRKVITRVKPNQWNARDLKVNSKHSEYNQLNLKISLEMTRIQERINNGAKTKNEIFDKDSNSTETSKVYVLLDSEIEQFKANEQLSMLNQHKTLRRDLNAFDNSFPTRSFADIDVGYIEGFYLYLRQTLKNSLNTSAKKMQHFNRLFSRAIELGLYDRTPFARKEFKTERTIKRKLTKEEFLRIEELDLSGRDFIVQLSRDLFVFSVYLRGIRVGDALQIMTSNIDGNKVTYREGKTGKIRSFTLRPEALEIIERYKDGDGYVFPFLRGMELSGMDLQRKIQSATTQINAGLKVVKMLAKISKPLTTHIARHTFSKMAIDAVSNPRISQGLVGHASLAVHQAYIQDIEDSDELDSAADSIFD